MRHCDGVRGALLVVANGVLCSPSVLAQAPAVHTYYVNDGRDDTHSSQFGEYAIDLGGNVDWDRYANTDPITGHYYAKLYNPTTPPGDPPTFQGAMFEGCLDLEYVNYLVKAHCGILGGIFRPNGALGLAPGEIVQDPELVESPTDDPTTTFPMVRDAWWNAQGGPRQVMYWPYVLNGAPMMVCVAYDPSTGLLALNGMPHILLYNYPTHLSAFGANKNLWCDQGSTYNCPSGRRREFSGPITDASAPEGGWPGTAAAPLLGPKEQALEQGDIVVFVWERYSESFWTALQRTQEAEWYVRHTFAAGPPAPGFPSTTSFAPLPSLGRSALWGKSWGRVVAQILALMQPNIYGGSAAWINSDIGYSLEDHWELENTRQPLSGGSG